MKGLLSAGDSFHWCVIAAYHSQLLYWKIHSLERLRYCSHIRCLIKHLKDSRSVLLFISWRLMFWKVFQRLLLVVGLKDFLHHPKSCPSIPQGCYSIGWWKVLSKPLSWSYWLLPRYTVWLLGLKAILSLVDPSIACCQHPTSTSRCFLNPLTWSL